MNESITRAAGAAHGQETNPSVMLDMISDANRIPRPRTTIYNDLSSDRLHTALEAGELSEIINSPAKKYERRDRRKLIRSSANV
jgi:FO synthase